ncbi:amino acid adenylation domain-containing protein [Atopobacter sp. AH10]|uniref:D-alanine--poly(phosphoribitol) ligase subunit DltA n=1 Tax=Atopobacter sp. AH10 TaxID=2315861 RepID=UPI000EF26AFF|nr:D-alanine--poly(phosphoribitol) ligase subunit DltA [Atopobacter sp. AH10]RLK63113.1 amino acid adenylation domain-containing protein [Atopobacter sp. AH10]
MDILKRIEEVARTNPEREAFIFANESIKYGELWKLSGELAKWILSLNIKRNIPIPIYGHKNIWMPICMLAATRSGHAYVPIDISMPEDRVKFIVKAVESPLAINTEANSSFCQDVLKTTREDLEKIVSPSFVEEKHYKELTDEDANQVNDIHYIIFTSGSTGSPKGVKITTGNLANYLKWSETLVEKKAGVFLNQAPFSFDLSVMDTYTGLVTGSTIASLNKEKTENIKEALKFIKENKVTYWVSTPSFAEMCLSSDEMNGAYLKSMRKFLFCGEPLKNQTAKNLLERFSKADVINTYGPTESTVCVTSVKISKEIVEKEKALPVGVAKEGTSLYSVDEEGKKLPYGERGELIITGNTVAAGYFNDPVRTSESFFTNEDGEPAYRTGDLGYVTSDGMVYCSGRKDTQIKLHGYRIEIGDIERNLLDIEGVEDAIILIELKDGVPNSLTACVSQVNSEDQSYHRRKYIRESLRAKLPKYMVPKKIVFFEKFPITPNGKVDKKKMREAI